MENNRTTILGIAINENSLLSSAYLLSFLIPFVLTKPQIVIGTIVNFFLIFLAFETKSLNKIWPILLLPSLATLSRGLIFGPFTPFLAYFLPFIWISNLILVLTIQKLNSTKINTAFTLLVAALIKSLFLFVTANLFFHYHLVPQLFLQSMGSIQFITAVTGGFIYLGIKLAQTKN